ncbi:hypothetical protein KY343_04610 [Candidatus Woesearchaeota archaeon]|nr:hypothetical protein [Candidatus Woesearchaeota archaeon]
MVVSKRLFLILLCGLSFILLALNVSASCSIGVQSSACDGEYVDITVSGRYYLSALEMLECANNFGSVEIDIYLWEDDVVGDDYITGITKFFQAVESPTYCAYVDYSHTFTEELGSFAGGTEGNTIEIYSISEINNGPYTGDCTTSPQNVDITFGQCGSGVCCDLSTCNYRLPSYKCGEDIQTDYGCPWGTSPGDDVGVHYADKYCSGSSSSCTGSIMWGAWSVQDNCNSDEMCIDNNPSCQAVGCSSDSDCGTDGWVGSTYCSGNDVYQSYRTYDCNNPGTPSSSCSSTDTPTLKQNCPDTCSGGSCVGIACYSDLDCGTDGWAGSNYCSGGDVYRDYRTYDCNNPGTPSSSCSSSTTPNMIESCPDECQAGACVSIECSSNSDCGVDWYVGYPYCNSGDVWWDYRTYICINPGTTSSSCSHSTTPQLYTSCSDGCDGGQCIVDGYLWYVDWWNDKIYKLTTDGTVVDSFNSPGSASTGITWDGSHLWIVDAQADKVYKVTTFGIIVDTINAPSSSASGLTWCKSYLWVSDSTDDKIYRMSTDGTVSDSFNTPGDYPYGLGCANDYWILNADMVDQKVYSIEWFSGVAHSDHNAPSSSPYGIAYDGSFYWSSDYTNKRVYKLDPGFTVLANFIPPGIYGGALDFQPASEVIECYSTSDCDSDGYVGDTYCTSDDVYQDYRTYSCTNPGTTSSACSYSDSSQLIEDCGTGSCGSWSSNYCKSGDVYKSRTCYNRGCLSGACYESEYIEEQLVQTCADACWSGSCTTISCYTDSDCGTNTWVGSSYCNGNDLWQDYRTYTCSNPGTPSSSCSYSDNGQLKQDCPDTCYSNACATIECYSNSDCGTNTWIGSTYCSGDNVWQGYRTYTCSSPGTPSSSCSYSDNNQLKETCPDTCSGGSCDPISCYNDAECGTDGWVGSTYCSGDDVWQDYRTYTCSNPGTSSSSCSSSITSSLKETCTEICYEGSCATIECYNDAECGTDGWVGSTYCSGDDVWQDYRTYTCSNPGTALASCSYSDASQSKEICTDTCESGLCVAVECYDDNDCTADYWLDNDYCNGDNVWDTFRDYSCSNPGTGSSSCDYADNNQLKETCTDTCYQGNCAAIECYYDSDCGTDDFIGNEYCNADDVWDYYRTYICNNPGTPSASCSYSDNGQLIEQCPKGCTLGRCINCIKVCSFGKCYEYCDE